MASPTTPMHGKLAAVYLMRPNGFNGAGLNDLTWGAGYDGAASASFEVVIDGVGTGGGGVDQFKWRKNGGGWTEHVDITGAAQALSDSQTITFAATTGHTSGDKWLIGNLKDEATTEAAATAQITDSTMRILNPNAPPVFTDDGGKIVEKINYAAGMAYFSGNVGNVTATGNNGFIPFAALQQVGYLIDCSFNISLDLAEISAQGDQWKSHVPGQATGNGAANAYFIATGSPFKDIEENITDQKYFMIEMSTYDPDQDQTGDRFRFWVVFSSWNANAPKGDVVKESVNFSIHGMPSFVANA